MPQDFDPYYKWLGVPPDEQPPDHYRLLGIRRLESDLDVISHAADRQMAHVRSFQSGNHAEDSQRLLNEISGAKICLLNAESKAAYDAKLRSILARKRVPTGPAKPSLIVRPITDQPPTGALPEVQSPEPKYGTAERLKSKRTQRTVPIALTLAAAAVVLVIGLFLFSSRQDPQRTAAKVEPSRQSRRTSEPPPSPSRKPPANIGKPPAGEPAIPTDLDSENAPIESPPDSAVAPGDATAPSVTDAESTPDPPPSEPDPVVRKQPVPDAESRDAAWERIRQLYGKELDQAKSREERLAMSQKLLETGRKEKDPLHRYVLLDQAATLAAEAGDFSIVSVAIDELSTSHAIHDVERKAEILIDRGESSKTPVEQARLARAMFAVYASAVMSDDYQTASRLLEAAIELARSSRSSGLVKCLSIKKEELEQLSGAHAEVEAATALLDDNPIDPAANLTVGQFLCFLKDDWKEGIPFLARSRLQEIKNLATIELENPVSLDIQLNLADGWLALAGAHEGLSAKHVKQRAAHWYRKALPKLEGLDKVRGGKSVSRNPSHDPASDRRPARRDDRRGRAQRSNRPPQ